MNLINKFKPKKFKRHDRNDGGKTHIGYIADEVSKAIPKEIENIVCKDKEYLGLNYLVLPVLVHKAVLELNDKIDKLEKGIKGLKKENLNNKYIMGIGQSKNDANNSMEDIKMKNQEQILE